MKTPPCRQEDETKQECINRKIPELREEGYEQDEAYAIASSMCSKKCSAGKEHPLDDYDTRRKYWEMKINKEDENEEKFKKKLKEYFEKQKKNLMEVIRQSKNIVDENFDPEIQAKIAKDEFLPLLRQFAQESGQDAIDFSGGSKEFNLGTELSITLNKRADLFSQEINETTYKSLQESFKQSVEMGESREELEERISQTFDETYEGRAATIARTETGVAMTAGTFQGYKDAGVKEKVWTAVMDANTRDTHMSLDGEKKPIDQPFSNGLMHPRDPNGRASEVINCRCVI